MLTEYIERAMRHAHYELMENGRFFGTILPCKGAWGEGATLEECRQELRGALESWLMVGLRHGDLLPVIDGIDLRRQGLCRSRLSGVNWFGVSALSAGDRLKAAENICSP